MEIKDVPGLPIAISETGEMVACKRTFKLYAIGVTKPGYHQMQKTINRKRKTFMIHRLVAMAFIGTPEGYESLEVNHKDADKSNNHFSNLEWSTKKENMDHGKSMKLFKHGGFNKRERNEKIFRDFKSATSRADLCVKYGLKRSALNAVIRRMHQ